VVALVFAVVEKRTYHCTVKVESRSLHCQSSLPGLCEPGAAGKVLPNDECSESLHRQHPAAAVQADLKEQKHDACVKQVVSKKTITGSPG
jgi:hypothetical protein